MTYGHLERELGRSKDPGDREELGIIRALKRNRKARGQGDIPLPETKTKGRKTPEVKIRVKKFSVEAREALEREGFQIYTPREVSLKSLQAEGKPFWYINPKFIEAVSSLHSQVAINPKREFLPDSFRKLPAGQETLLEKFNRDEKQLPSGTKAILADEPSLWGEIYHMHQEITGEVLFKGRYTLSKSSVGWAVFGGGRADGGPGVTDWTPEDRAVNVGVALLVVPE